MAFRNILILLIAPLLISSCRIVSVSAASDPIICFTFDDQHEGVYRVALPIMRDLGFRGTCFVNTGRIDIHDSLTKDQLVALHQNYGWEIGGHTLYHDDLVSLNYQQARHTISQDYFNLLNWGLEPRSFAHPCGDCPMEYFSIITDYYRTVRGSNDMAMHVPLNRLGLGYLPYQTGWNASIIKDRIQRGIADHEELIIIGFHQVDAGSPHYVANCETDQFIEIMNYVRDLGLIVLPLDEAVEKLSNWQ